MKTSIHTRFLAMLMALVMVLSMVPATAVRAQEETPTYTLVTDAASLKEGDQVLVVASGFPVALSTNQKTNNRGQSTVTKSEDGTTVTPGDDTQVITLGKGTKDGTWALKVDGGDLYAASSSANHLKTEKTLSDNGSWTIEIDAKGVATLKAQGTNSHNWLRYNKGNKLFSCYASGQEDVSLYRLNAAAAGRKSGLVTDLSTLKNGDTVVIFNPANKKALSSVYSGHYNSGVDVTLADGKLTGFTDAEVWTLTKGKDGYYTIATAEGKKLSMDTGYSSTPLDAVNDKWELTAAATADCFYVKNVARKAYLEWYASQSNWSGFGTIGDNEALFAQQIYYYAAEETPDKPVDPEEPATVSIETALKGSTGDSFTVKGVVTLVDGTNIYLQDATGGICLRLSAKDSTIALGDTLIGTGKRAEYNGLPQLSSGTFVKSSGLTLTAKDVKIADLTEAHVGTYVSLNNLEVTKVDDNNGQYSNPNITLKDADGKTIQLYKAVIDKDAEGVWTVKVGDKLNVKAAVSIYAKNGTSTLQLRNTLASEVSAYVAGILPDGTYVIYNASSGKAMSATDKATYYRTASTVTLDNGKVVKPTNDLLWDLKYENGVYTVTSQEGKKLSMNADRNSLPMDDVNATWTIAAAATEGAYYLVNANRPDFYVEYYSGTDKNGNAFEEFSTYKYSSSKEAIYALQFIPAEAQLPGGELPNAGDKVVIYNPNAEAVLAAQNDNTDSPAINKAAATIEDGKAVCANGAVVFEVQKNGDYYRFYNKTYGYLCSNGTGNNAFYSQTASEDADWTLRTCSGGVGGFEMESRTAKYNGTYSQWLEYYADSFKTYSMYNVTDYTIYSFYFYPVTGVTVVDGIVNNPTVNFGTVEPAYVGQDYHLTFTVDAPFGVRGDMTALLNGDALTVTLGEDGTYTVTIPTALVTGDKLIVSVRGMDNKYIPINGTVEIEVKDEPVISDLTPAANTQTGENKRPTISASIANAGENPTVTMTVNDAAVDAKYADGKITYTPAADMADGRTTVKITVKRADGKTAEASWSFTLGKSSYQLYFGQLHAHTQYSDGSGSLDSALDYVANLPDSANVDFVAFTDHSNYFDSKNNPNVESALYDTTLVKDSDASHSWATYKSTINAFNARNTGVVALGGFEMTWSGGPGHINTWVTPGVVSRNNTTLNNKTDDAGMKAYYALLSQPEGVDSISQFNHPGSTFGTFKDFSYWDPVIDSRMYLVEVGNGEGQIGAGGYYPSYEQYIVALDKGWHVAPSNNQDNHKGRWGNANDARDVILAESLSEDALYEAIRAMRVYATEDKNLEITYTVNGNQLGSILTEVPENLSIDVTLYDPDKTDSISKVEVVVNSGKTAYTWDNAAELASGSLHVDLEPKYSYYFIRVTQGDGDLAVTAPVWVGDSLKLGLSAFESKTATPVTGESMDLVTTLFNSEAADATVKSISYTVGSEVLVIKTNDDLPEDQKVLKAGSTMDLTFPVEFDKARVYTVTATVVLTMNGEDFTFTKDLSLDVLDADALVYIGIDASHYNEYVSGNYKDSMGNFSNLAAGYSVRTVQLNTSEDLIAACGNEKYKAIVLTAPSRRLADAQTNPKTYSAAELEAITAFNDRGGTVVLAGWSDNYENYDVIQNNPAIKHMAETQNDVLAALGSSLRISDDATYDDVRSAADGVDKWRLYFSSYNMANPLLEGVEVDEEHPYDKMYTERFSHYGGASIYAVDASGNPTSTLPDTVSPAVYGHATTYSVDVDQDGKGGAGIPKYAYGENDDRLMVMATEQLPGKGLIVVSGAAFLSNFEVQATISDNGSEKNYSNYKICENLVKYLNPVQITPIGTVNKVTETGYKYTIEGIVTANASGYDKDTAFFDCTYVQDETGGINVFPVAGDFKIGDKVRITGTTAFYQGEIELSVTSIEKLSENNPVEATNVIAAQVNDGSVTGLLVKLKGVVTGIEYANGLVQTILVKDANGDVTRLFIDGYITTQEEVENLRLGCEVEATGLASYDDTFVLEDGTAFAPRIRIRNRADIICGDVVEHVHSFGAWVVVKEPTETETGLKERKCDCGETEQEIIPALGKPDKPTEPSKPTEPTKPGTTPATGDTLNVPVLVAVLVVAAVGIGLLLFFLLRKKKDEKK